MEQIIFKWEINTKFGDVELSCSYTTGEKVNWLYDLENYLPVCTKAEYKLHDPAQLMMGISRKKHFWRMEMQVQRP